MRGQGSERVQPEGQTEVKEVFMGQETPAVIWAEEHDLEELDLDGRELHPQDLDDGEEDLEEEDELFD